MSVVMAKEPPSLIYPSLPHATQAAVCGLGPSPEGFDGRIPRLHGTGDHDSRLIRGVACATTRAQPRRWAVLLSG